MTQDTFNLQQLKLDFFPRSLSEYESVEYGLARTKEGPQLVVLVAPGSHVLEAFEGESADHAVGTLLVGPMSPRNAAALRAQLNWLNPRKLGLDTSVGMGDRLGLATPGHVRAMLIAGGGAKPIFAQQSIREMARSIRTPQQVMDDAMWGIFQEGWRDGVGADADHLKKPEDIDICLEAGYTFFTIDPGDHVDNRAETASLSELREMAAGLPVELQPQSTGLLGKTVRIEELSLDFTEAALLKAAVKYGKALLHVADMYRHLVQAAGQRQYELEVSVDETDMPTSHVEHVYVAVMLKRLGVDWVSLAPRYVGRFEKGVDYIGDVAAFEADIKGHAAIARQYGPYKLSLHSGSDKFSVYPAMNRQTQGVMHLKTAGTSYLEALRTIAEFDPGFLKEIYTFARERYETDRATYHVSAELGRAPLPDAVSDWANLFEQFDAREILHVTFGSVMSERDANGERVLYNRLMKFLRANSEAYAGALERHFVRHLRTFLSNG